MPCCELKVNQGCGSGRQDRARARVAGLFPFGGSAWVWEMNASVEDLFHEVADLPVEARAVYFDKHGVDGMTRSEVEALMAFDLRSTNSFDEEIGDVARRALEQLEPRDLRCGPYRLGEMLGRGGMGAVYLAERVDGEVTQQVAVKLLRPGADSRELRQRFLAERQILATLSHPNIARLLDAGHREDGQPYLVMEYVEGKPSTSTRPDSTYAARSRCFKGVRRRRLPPPEPGGASRLETGEHSGHGGRRSEITGLRYRQDTRLDHRLHNDEHAHADAGLRQPGTGGGARSARRRMSTRWAQCFTNC